MCVCLCEREKDEEHIDKSEEEKGRRKGKRRKYAEVCTEFPIVVITENNKHE